MTSSTVNDLPDPAGDEVAQSLDEASSGTPADLRKEAILALKLLAALVVIAAPILIAANFVPGVSAVAFFGVLATAFGWISGGPRIGAAVVASLAVLGVISIMLREHTWALAVIIFLLGLAYGYAASRGVGKAVLQLPILTPYFISNPPALFQSPPVIDAKYLIGVIVVMLLTGGWTLLILHFAAGKRELKPLPVQDPRIPIIYGVILGVFAAIVMVIGTTAEVKTHWVWVTLTLYVLADPQQLFAPLKMGGRMLGTMLGFAVVSVLAIIGMPSSVLHVVALLALWMCMVFIVLKKPYWEYTLFLTIAVILMDFSDVHTLLLNTERMGFTLLGAGISLAAAFLVNLLGYRRIALTAPGQM